MTAVTVERWEVEQVAPCLRCGGPTTVAPVAMGTLVGGGVVCDPCRFYLKREGEWGAFLAHILPDGPDGSPAAPAARPGTLTLVAAGRGPAGYELSPEEERELDEFERLVSASAPDPAPCTRCGRPASPSVETDVGRVCLACADRGAGGPTLQRAVRLRRTVCRLAAARLHQTVVEASTTAVLC